MNGALADIFIVFINLRPLKIVHKIECHGDGVGAGLDNIISP